MRVWAVLALTPLFLVACAASPPPAPIVTPPPPVETSAAPIVAPPPPAPPARVQVHGRVLGSDGAPMKLAHVHHGDKSLAADASGAFAIELDAGFQELRVTGVDHAARTFGLYLDPSERTSAVAVDLVLGTYDREGPLDRVVVMWSHREGDGPPELVGARAVKRNPRGVFEAELTPTRRPGAVWPPRGQLLYQVRGLAKGHIVNGPEAERFVYDGDGDYLSVPASSGSSAFKVRLDPARLPPPNAEPRLVFADPTSRSARISTLHLEAMRRLEAASGTTDFRAPIVKALATETDADVIAALRLAYLTPPPPPSEEATRIAEGLLSTLPAKSSLWRFHPEAALDAMQLAPSVDHGEPRRGVPETPPGVIHAFLTELVDGLDDPSLASGFLLERVRRAARAGREAELSAVYAVLHERFAKTPAGRAAAIFDPARRVRPSHELPDFDLPAFGGAKDERITRASLRGKVVLIDFWGTWCPPCIAEVKHLDAAYAKHKGEGLVIVSIAAHDTAARVRRFRGASPMPWKHVVLDKAAEDELLERFEVHAFPSEILVDREGRITRIGAELRGEALEPAIAAALAR